MALYSGSMRGEWPESSRKRLVREGRRNLSLRCLFAGTISFVLATLSLAAQPGEVPPPIPDTAAIIPGDSLSLADSLALADTVQPELRVGVFGGVLSTNATVANIPLNPISRTGFHGGVRAEMEFGYPIYFFVEFEYAQKGVRSNYVLASGATVEEEFFFNYLDVPIMYRVGIPLSSRFSISGGFGAHVSLLLSRSHVVRIGDVDSVLAVKGLENFDFGIEGRLGGEFALAPKWGLTADFRYLHGLQNILILEPNKRDDRSWKSRSIFFSAGIMYQLQRSIR